MKTVMDDRRTTHPNWIMIVLSSLGATLAGGLLLAIAATTFLLAKEVAVLQTTVAAQTLVIRETARDGDADIKEIKEWFAQLWPRTRVLGTNMQILKRQVEALCNCSIKLEQPERF